VLSQVLLVRGHCCNQKGMEVAIATVESIYLIHHVVCLLQ
jgi:hypothetical protein